MPRNDKPGLAEKMRKLAVVSSRATSLIALAKALDEATEVYFADPRKLDVKKIVAFNIAYAEARVLYCEETGEPLVP